MALSLIVERAGPGCTIQAAPRDGFMHHGVPPGGPLVPELSAAANRALGNSDSDAFLEAMSPVLLRVEEPGTLALDGEPRSVEAGDEVIVGRSEHEAVGYLSVPGGFDVPLVLGSRGTLVSAGIGGFQGRALRRGDRLCARLDAPGGVSCVSVPANLDAPIRVVPGPDRFSDEAVEALLTREFRVSAVRDRVGQRLEGAQLPGTRDRVGSMPMVRGAIQVTLDGTLIVLGPDHPTTGGYPVIAVVLSADVGRLARRKPGASVRFTRTDLSAP